MEHSACFIGHRKIKDSPELREHIKKTIEQLITEKGITNFLFGDHSEFDSLCYETVTEMQKMYPHIRRIHFRKDYENAEEYTMRFLLKGYEDSICPKGVSKAGKAGYVERNQNMIRESEVCVFYYDSEYMPNRRKESSRSVTTKTETISKTTEHAYGNWTKKDDNTHTRSCACGDVQTENHTWDNGKVTTAATHTKDGVKTFTCTKCGATKTEKIPAEKDNHSFSDWVAIDEHTHGRKCECGKEEKGNHSESGWIIDKNPTTTSEGSRHKECTECGYVLVTEAIAKLENTEAESRWERIQKEVEEQFFKVSVSQNEGGKVKTNPEKSVKYGDDVIITIIPDEGYEVESLTVKGKNVGKVTSYKLKNASSDVNITVKFKEAKWENPFTDISESDKYYKAVQYVYENELFKGVSEHQFAPNKTMTRAMFVTVLGRLAKVDESKYTKTSFTDAKNGEWYSAYVEWASENGIVNGYGNGKFGVNDEVTIEQAAAIIARYAKFIKIDTTGKTLGNYSDKSDVSDWAVADMAWLTSAGIYAPENNKLLPKAKAERQLVATMISGFAEKYVK